MIAQRLRTLYSHEDLSSDPGTQITKLVMILHKPVTSVLWGRGGEYWVLLTTSLVKNREP